MGTTEIKSIDSEQLNEMLKSQPIFLIDCRENSEHESGVIENSHLFPMYQVPVHLDEIKEAKEEGKIIIAICASGGRSLDVARFLTTNGVETINVKDGIKGWLERNYPLVAPQN